MAGKYPIVWELDSLYPNPETNEFRSIVDRHCRQLRALADASDRLPSVEPSVESADAWGRFVDEYSQVSSDSTSIHTFVECHAAADANNKVYQRYEAELAALGPLTSQISTNVEFALQSPSEAELDEFISLNASLQANEFFLKNRRAAATLRLPREQEMLLADLNVDGLQGWSRLYDRLSGELRISIMERGEVVQKSPSQVQFNTAHRTERENNFCAANKAWATIADTCAESLNHIAGSRLTKYKRLGIDHLDVPLKLNRMQRQTLETMWGVITDRKNCLADFLDAKARLMGLEKLSWFDLQAPLPLAGQSAGRIGYDDACDLIVEAFTEFSPELGDFAKMIINNSWIEVEDRPRKRQGGFSTDLPSQKQTRIFMTFTDSVDSMSTLAHEIGHSYHTWVLRDQPVFLRDYPMNLAETASTFAEAVLGENRLKSASSKMERLQLLDTMVSDAATYLMNIHTRFLFEDEFHKQRAHGELSAEQLSELMVASQKEAYLGALAEDGWNPLFWVSKLHFYIAGWPFYNFPYTFGYLLSLGTYSMAKDSNNFPDQFRNFLLATGNQLTEDAVEKSLGYDLRQPEFWHRSLDVIEAKSREFVELANEPN